MTVHIFKVDEMWCFEANGQVILGYSTKDEAQFAAEKHLVDQFKTIKGREALKRKEEIEPKKGQ